MSDHVQHSEPSQPKLPTLQAGGQVRPIVPQDFEGAWRIAQAVVKAGMAPDGLDTPEKAMVAIMHGLEVGMTPMAALQSIAVVNGRPTIWGDGAIGLVRGSGKLEWIKERIEGDGDAMTAICEVKRKGEPDIVFATFSVADAKNAGLWGKRGRNGAPTPWVTYPKRMLAMRARAFALRDAFADVLRGLGIAEEVQDFQPMKDVTPKSATALAPPPPPPPTQPVREPSSEVAPKVDVVPEVDEPAGSAGGDLVPGSGEYFEKLEADLLSATTEEDLEEMWAAYDVEATFDGDDANIGIARAIKRNALKKIKEGSGGKE